MNVIIKIDGREAIPVRALPLLAEWGTMNPEKIAGALGRVTDENRRPLFDNLHDMNAFYVEDGTVHPVTEQNWRDHMSRQLEALNDQLKLTEISHSTGYGEWQVKALEILPEDAFVWKDEYEPLYDRTYGPQSWANLSDDTRKAMTARGKEPPPALTFKPHIANKRMETLVKAALDVIGRAIFTANETANDVAADSHEQPSSEASTNPQVEILPFAATDGADSAGPAPLPAVPTWKMQIQTEATEHCLRLRKSGANPTRNSILDSMAKWCRDNNIKTATKIHPSANYLRTHVLGGKHWDVPN